MLLWEWAFSKALLLPFAHHLLLFLRSNFFSSPRVWERKQPPVLQAHTPRTLAGTVPCWVGLLSLPLVFFPLFFPTLSLASPPIFSQFSFVLCLLHVLSSPLSVSVQLSSTSASPPDYKAEGPAALPRASSGILQTFSNHQWLHFSPSEKTSTCFGKRKESAGDFSLSDGLEGFCP